MTRKHFQAIAEVLGKEKVSDCAINAVANVCADLNPRFDRARFVAAVFAARREA